jgi:hypothetical protein
MNASTGSGDDQLRDGYQDRPDALIAYPEDLPLSAP